VNNPATPERGHKLGPVITIVGDQPQYLYMLRSARRKARVLGVEWYGIIRPTVYGPTEVRPQLDMPAVIKRKEGHQLKIPEQGDFNNSLLNYFKARVEAGTAPSTIIVPEGDTPFWKRLLKIDIASRLRRAMGRHTEVLSIPLVNDSYLHRSKWLSILDFKPMDLFYCGIAVLVATGLIEVLMRYIPEMVSPSVRNKSLIYLMACVFAAGRYGLLPGLITAVISFFALNMLYISAAYRLALTTGSDAVNLILFVLAAAFVAIALGQNRAEREMFQARAKRVQALLQLHWVTIAKRNRPEAVSTLHSELSHLLEAPVAFFLTTAEEPNKPSTIFPPDTVLNEVEEKALLSCWEDAKATGAHSVYFPKSRWRFEPLIIANGEIGALGVQMNDSLRNDNGFGHLFTAVADQAAHIIERADLGIVMEESRVREEKTKLRSMLLSSVSHDLKTPLASVIGSLSVFRSMQAHLPEEHRKTLIDTALEEAQRLDSFITNILDMTRLESGDVKMKQDWTPADAMIKNVLKRLRTRLIRHNVELKLERTDIEVCLDIMMTEQVLQNVLDNAVKYTPSGTLVEISIGFNKRAFQIYVRDHGGGIPENGEDRIFDKFTRLNRLDSQIAGTGLGLAICKSVMQAQNGNIVASNHPDGGALFTITLPKWRKLRFNPNKDAA